MAGSVGVSQAELDRTYFSLITQSALDHSSLAGSLADVTVSVLREVRKNTVLARYNFSSRL